MSKQDELSHVIRCVEHYGTVIGNRTINEHWVVNGVRFNHMPSESEVEEAYTRPTPQADEVKRLEEELHHYKNALWKACGDTEETVNAYLEDVGYPFSHKEEAE
jgi:hypothetical protein